MAGIYEEIKRQTRAETVTENFALIMPEGTADDDEFEGDEGENTADDD
jgi:hypothetical protein